MTGDPLPDTDHVLRHCSPSRVENGMPTVAAFQLGSYEPYLSVSWLEFFGRVNTPGNISCAREVLGKKLTLRQNGRLAVLCVGSIKAAVGNPDQRIEHIPQDDDPSHSGIYPAGDLDLAVELRALITADDVYLAVVQ